MTTLKQRGINFLIALDQLFGVVISLGAQYPDETPSSYAYRLDKNGRFFGKLLRPAIDKVFNILFNQTNHCYMAYIEERDRYQLPPMLRDGAPDVASRKI